MKRVIFADQCANRDLYVLALPDSMDKWSARSLFKFLNYPQSESRYEGYLPLPVDPLHFEQFRQIFTRPAMTMNAPVILCLNGNPLSKDDEITLEKDDTIIEVTRADCDFTEVVDKVSLLNQNLTALTSCRLEIYDAIDRVLDLKKHPIIDKENEKLISTSAIIEHSRGGISDDEILRLISRLAKILYLSPFENITRLLDNRQSRPGYAVWKNIASGFGGICAEKTAALGFICDILGLRYSHVVGSLAELPNKYEDQLRTYVASGGEKPPPDWAQHHLIELHIGDEDYLIDTTNGNFPFMFLNSNDSKGFFRSGIRTRMVYNTERIKLRRTNKITGDLLLSLSQFHIPELHLQYIFKQGLGLKITSSFFIGVYFDWGGEQSMTQQNHYSSMAKKVGFPYPRFLHENNLDSIPDQNLREMLRDLLYSLRERYNHKHYTGDFTFVWQPVTNNFWESPKVSQSLEMNFEDLLYVS
jgi:hypothetical protein